MSNKPVSEDLRLRLAQSMPAIERRRSTIAEQMQEGIEALDGAASAPAQVRKTTTMLIDLLLEGASDLAAFGGLRDLSRVSREHRRLDIDGRHYSRFGLALASVLRQVSGLGISPKTIAAWCDAFWLIIAGVVAERAPEGRRTKSSRA